MKALLASLLFAFSSAYGAPEESVIYSCHPHGKSDLTLEITGKRATLSGRNQAGEAIDVMSYAHPERLRKGRKPSLTEVFKAGKSYAPFSQMTIDHKMREASQLGAVTVYYQNGHLPEKFLCRLAEIR